MAWWKKSRVSLWILLGLVVSTCGAAASDSWQTSTPFRSDSWQTTDMGLAYRTYIPHGDPLAQLLTLRLDPTQYEFRVHYTPGEAYRLNEWRSRLPDADLIVNANFFEIGHQALGLVVSDGVAYGGSYQRRGGTFAVTLDGDVWLQGIQQRPYQGESLWQAIQAFPMLMIDGVQAFTDPNSTRRSRRTFIAQDAEGQIIIAATPGIGLSLFDLSAYLAQSDMNLITALNLDGGGSTMLYSAELDLQIASFDAVPVVLAAYRRES